MQHTKEQLVYCVVRKKNKQQQQDKEAVETGVWVNLLLVVVDIVVAAVAAAVVAVIVVWSAPFVCVQISCGLSILADRNETNPYSPTQTKLIISGWIIARRYQFRENILNEQLFPLWVFNVFFL